MRIFDTHCHLASKDLRDKATALVLNCKSQNVWGLSIIAADEETLSLGAQMHEELRQSHPDFKFAFSSGIHPHEAKDFDQTQKNKVIELASRAHAIGETGLDFFYDFSDRTQQEDAFLFHIELALKTKKPLVIHCRNSAHEILEVLDRGNIKEHPKPGILHCFAESWDLAQEFLKRNLMISFSGILTFKNADSLRETASKIPLESLLVETDSPYLAPIPHRGKQNEPSFVRHTLDCLTKVRSENPHLVQETLWQNSLRLFDL